MAKELTPESYRSRRATAPEGDFPLVGGGNRARASDAMIKHLGSLWQAESKKANAATHFERGGFSSHDLVLGSTAFRRHDELVHYRKVMQQAPGASDMQEPTQGPAQEPAVSIVSRLTAYIGTLFVPEDAINESCGITNAHARAQVGLNELLLEHPILLHPRLKIILDGATSLSVGALSIAHAIMVTRYAAFPRLSDWVSLEAPGTGSSGSTNPAISDMKAAALRKRLKKLAGSKVLAMGLATPELMIGNAYWSIKGRAALDCLPTGWWRPRLILSLQELAELRSPTPDSARFTDFRDAGGVLNRDGDYGVKKEGLYFATAMSNGLIRAAGINPYDTPSVEAADPDPVRKDFFDLVRRRGPECRDGALEEMNTHVFAALFGFGAVEASNDGIAARTRTLVSALVESELHPTPVAAAEWLRERLSRGGLPMLSVEQVVTYFRTLRDLGAPVPPDHPFVSVASETWATGLKVVSVEDAMKAKLDETITVPATAAARRTRAGI